MKNEFIETINVSKFNALCGELSDPMSLIGPSLGMVTGPAGRGKSEAAKRLAAQTDTVYIPPLNIRTPTMILREIAFELAKIRPNRSDACIMAIGDEMSKVRKLIIIDEADLLPIAVLEMLRNVSEYCASPFLFIGEDNLKNKVACRRRLASRIRRKLEFGPVTQQDIAYYFKRTLNLKITPDMTAPIARHCRGDWRPAITVAISIERAMKTSCLSEITLDLVKDVLRNR